MLVHDFGGCTVEEVLARIGFTLEDLFPERPQPDSVRRERRPWTIAQGLDVLDREAGLICLAALNIGNGAALKPQDCERVLVAHQRISTSSRCCVDNLDAAITAIDEARKKAAAEPPPEPILLDLDALSDVEPAAVRFIVDRWLPACEAALFAGHGGTAKSWIALILAVCIALGRDFFGYHCERRRVMYYSCEDRLQVLHWRLARICRHLGVNLADLAGWLYVYDATASDNVLYWGAAESPAERITARYDWLREKAAEHEVEVLFLDAVTDVIRCEREHPRAREGLRPRLPAARPPARRRRRPHQPRQPPDRAVAKHDRGLLRLDPLAQLGPRTLVLAPGDGRLRRP